MLKTERANEIIDDFILEAKVNLDAIESIATEEESIKDQPTTAELKADGITVITKEKQLKDGISKLEELKEIINYSK